MAFEIVPNRLWNFPTRFSTLLDDEEDWAVTPHTAGGITIAEDDGHVYIESAVPGVDPKNIEITFDKGILWIKGETKEEEENKKKKFYRKASSSFSYRVAVPGELDQNKEPEADIKHGVVKVTFEKAPQSHPKKIQIKAR